MPQTEHGVMQVITCYLAGRAAESLIFNETLIGHGGSDGSDLEIATTNAVRLETVLGCARIFLCCTCRANVHTTTSVTIGRWQYGSISALKELSVRRCP